MNQKTSVINGGIQRGRKLASYAREILTTYPELIRLRGRLAAIVRQEFPGCAPAEAREAAKVARRDFYPVRQASCDGGAA